MPLINISSSTVTHECTTCSMRRETLINTLRLGTPKAPDRIVLPSCDCGAFETLQVTSTPSKDLLPKGVIMHEHMVRALGVLLEAGNHTAAEFVHQDPYSDEVTAQILRSGGSKKRRNGGAE